MSATEINDVAANLGLTMEAKFIPWSLSRNAGEKQPCLNWKVTLIHQGRRILTTDYMAGCAHCPSYKQADKSVDGNEAVRLECETGRRSTITGGGPRTMTGSQPLMPVLADVLSSLASDASAIDSGSFESWASDFGYNTDSLEAERIYLACVDIGLKLRAALGEDGLKALHEACQDY